MATTANPTNLNPNGWTWLHSGGAVLCEDGIPVRVSDGVSEGEAADGSRAWSEPTNQFDILDDLRTYGWVVELSDWDDPAAGEPDATAEVSAAFQPKYQDADDYANDATDLERLHYGGTLYRTEADLAGHVLYDWISGGDVLTHAEVEAALTELDPDLDGLAQGWGDAIADYLQPRLDAAKRRCREIAIDLGN